MDSGTEGKERSTPFHSNISTFQTGGNSSIPVIPPAHYSHTTVFYPYPPAPQIQTRYLSPPPLIVTSPVKIRSSPIKASVSPQMQRKYWHHTPKYRAVNTETESSKYQSFKPNYDKFTIIDELKSENKKLKEENTHLKTIYSILTQRMATDRQKRNRLHTNTHTSTSTNMNMNMNANMNAKEDFLESSRLETEADTFYDMRINRVKSQHHFYNEHNKKHGQKLVRCCDHCLKTILGPKIQEDFLQQSDEIDNFQTLTKKKSRKFASKVYETDRVIERPAKFIKKHNDMDLNERIQMLKEENRFLKKINKI